MLSLRLAIIFQIILCLILFLAQYAKQQIELVSILITFIIFIAFVVFQITYVKSYPKLYSLRTSYRKWFFQFYTFSSVLIFNALFLFDISLLLSLTNHYSGIFIPDAKVNEYKVFFFLIESIGDALTFQSFEALNIHFTKLTPEPKYGKIALHFIKMSIEISIVASVTKEITKRLKLRAAFKNIREGKFYDEEIFAFLDRLKIDMCLKQVNNNKDDVALKLKLLDILGRSRDRQVKELFILTLYETDDHAIFKKCANYVYRNKRSALKHLRKQIKEGWKLDILRKTGFK